MTPTMQAMSDFRSGDSIDSKAPERFSASEKLEYKAELIRLFGGQLERDYQELKGGI